MQACGETVEVWGRVRACKGIGMLEMHSPHKQQAKMKTHAFPSMLSLWSPPLIDGMAQVVVVVIGMPEFVVPLVWQ